MKTLKVNFAIVCMLLMTAVSVCLTSCGKEEVNLESAATEKTQIFEEILDASKGKLELDENGEFIVQLTTDDISPETLAYLQNNQSISLDSDLLLSSEETAEIFCVPNSNTCATEGEYLLEAGEYLINNPNDIESRNCIGILIVTKDVAVLIIIC